MKKISILLAALFLAGCSVSSNSNDPIVKDQQTVVASFYPIEFLTEEIVGSNFEVKNLTQGKDPHSYSLTPQDIQGIENSDLFIFQGAGLEPWAEDFENSASINSLELSQGIDLLDSSDHEDEHEEGDSHNEEDHDEHANDTDNHEESDEDHHEHGEFDPHTWLDPVLAQDMASQILEAVIALDPTSEAYYTDNYNLLSQKLAQLDESYQSSLSSCSNKKAISSHDAFSYLEERYDFELISVAGLSPQSLPSSQKIQELITLANQESITHILEEEFTDQSFSEVIKSEAGLDSLTINTLESSPVGDQDYISVMNSNLESFTQAFSCNIQ